MSAILSGPSSSEDTLRTTMGWKKELELASTVGQKRTLGPYDECRTATVAGKIPRLK